VLRELRAGDADAFAAVICTASASRMIDAEEILATRSDTWDLLL